MLSLHGLVRGHDLELGRDADTGGQVTYVVELARALGRSPAVERVDLLTRLVEDPRVSSDYARPVEELGPRARILRVPFGPRRYVRKEHLWGHLDHLVDRCLSLLGESVGLPHVLHSHYADAGYVGTQLSRILGIPLVHTGHSLGRVKRQRLLDAGRREAAIERQFNFRRRIAAEEETLEQASLVVASTVEEIERQWGSYENLRPRRALVIPPGIDTSRFSPPAGSNAPEGAEWIDRFLREPGKPMILALCRPAPKKNLARLVEAYATDAELRERANLVLVAGNRDDLRTSEPEERRVHSELLYLIDKYDLYGKVAFPKQHRPEDVAGLYRLATGRRGLFVNPALNEPFGLTLIEAAASGLPVVATRDGGPRDIVANCRNGLLFDPLDPKAIAAALKDALSDGRRWRQWSRNGIKGVREHYGWPAHVERYSKAVRRVLHRERKRLRRHVTSVRGATLPARLIEAGHVLVTDIDDTLLGDRESLHELLEWLRLRAPDVAFGIATGRTLPMALAILGEWGVPRPDLLVTSVGTEIHYGPSRMRDLAWTRHIRPLWRRASLADALSGLPGMTPQPAMKQGEFKLSYDIDPARLWPLERLQGHLRARGLHARLIRSQDRFLDVLPVRASKGLAIRHLAYRLGLPLERFLVAGDSGNDVEMLLGDTLGVVVGNHKPELKVLEGLDRVYFARASFAGGILEGIRHYGFASPVAAEVTP
ncbi:MAG TPA: HAD family hydrolase [Thermoanaerobaculia bacterium]|nr:HAD family hydrolase [Thermoanaerobaculia bacterium]